jgi:hypothetical protein
MSSNKKDNLRHWSERWNFIVRERDEIHVRRCTQDLPIVVVVVAVVLLLKSERRGASVR